MGNRTVLIAGNANTGKSTSLRNLKDSKSYIYLNGDVKALPLRGGASKFMVSKDVKEPAQLPALYAQAEAAEGCKGVILDTLTKVMDRYLRAIKLEMTGFDVWNAYSEHYKVMLDSITASNKTHIVMAHTDTVLNEQTGDNESKILISGAVGKIGVQSDFSIVVTSKQMPIAKLKLRETPLLTYTEDEEASGMKYVFSTLMNKATVGDTTRAPIGFWDRNEEYIDNSIQIILDRMDEYYGTEA